MDPCGLQFQMFKAMEQNLSETADIEYDTITKGLAVYTCSDMTVGQYSHVGMIRLFRPILSILRLYI